MTAFRVVFLHLPKHGTALCPNIISETKTIITKGETDPCKARCDLRRWHRRLGSVAQLSRLSLLNSRVPAYQRERLGAFWGLFLYCFELLPPVWVWSGVAVPLCQMGPLMMGRELNVSLPTLRAHQQTFLAGRSHPERPGLTFVHIYPKSFINGDKTPFIQSCFFHEAVPWNSASGVNHAEDFSALWTYLPLGELVLGASPCPCLRSLLSLPKKGMRGKRRIFKPQAEPHLEKCQWTAVVWESNASFWEIGSILGACTETLHSATRGSEHVRSNSHKLYERVSVLKICSTAEITEAWWG